MHALCSRQLTGVSDVGRRDGERGSIMLMACIFIVALVVGSWALIDAGQLLTARRDAYATASAAARAAAQGSDRLLRVGDSSIDVAQARADAGDVVSASGYALTGFSVDGRTVTVSVTVNVRYGFPPPPGLRSSVTGKATAISRRGVSGEEGG